MKKKLEIKAMSSVVSQACRANANNTAMRCNSIIAC